MSAHTAHKANLSLNRWLNRNNLVESSRSLKGAFGAFWRARLGTGDHSRLQVLTDLSNRGVSDIYRATTKELAERHLDQLSAN